ncbi:MAG: isoprenylcysteine carboxylmethyltransferase family protein [Melioribacter sp.]|nr:isoprenylcysteine carboxylmethyltransferase family protein [Melioribacter sp.]
MKEKKKILPPTYFISSIFIILIIHFIIPTKKIIVFPYNLLGILPLIISGILNIAADNALKKYNTTVKPFETSTSLVENGVYSFSRNPMYLGMTLFLLGESVILGSIGAILIVFLFPILIYSRFIKNEEKMLRDTFKKDYINYCNRVRRWI